MTRVVGTGTFDLLHPGHVRYLEKSRTLGDELIVIVARDINVKHKPKPVVPEQQRLRMVLALKAVDHAILGSETDIFESIELLKPDIITLGYDQHFDPLILKTELSKRGLDPKIVRIEANESCLLCSSRRIIAKILSVIVAAESSR
ncbi:MAG: FAD synthase [Methanotrichaceae archaeon]|nr:FAD synthase [Methanotrichaceae archaeon]